MLELDAIEKEEKVAEEKKAEQPKKTRGRFVIKKTKNNDLFGGK